jgi:hypothetical protein
MTERGVSGRMLSVDEAARQLDVEPAAVRMFVRQRFLRVATDEPMGVWEVDVHRLHRVLARQVTAAAIGQV